MKQININKKILEDIKKVHLKYCKEVLKSKGIYVKRTDYKPLFIEYPFDNDFNINPIYHAKYNDKYDFRALYTDFRTPKGKMKNEWCASKLIEKIDIKVCPYCGQQYFGLIPDKKTIAIK